MKREQPPSLAPGSVISNLPATDFELCDLSVSHQMSLVSLALAGRPSLVLYAHFLPLAKTGTKLKRTLTRVLIQGMLYFYYRNLALKIEIRPLCLY